MNRLAVAFTLLIGLSTLSTPGWAQVENDDWLPRLLAQFDSESSVAQQIDMLGENAPRDVVIRTAAAFFRSREPRIDLWVMPTSASASDRDIEWADKAVDHIITDRSGQVAFGDELPWFSAPEKLATLSRFPHFDYLTRAYSSTQDERYAAAMVRDMLDFVEHVPLSKSEGYHVQIAPNVNPWNWVLLQWRVKRWIDVLAHLRKSPSLSDEAYLRILLFVWDEVDWLLPRKVLGLHNGTLGNVSTILYASLHYPEARNASTWQREATAFLDAFLDSAFYPREFLIELTLGYSEGTMLMCTLMFEALPESPAKQQISDKLEAILDAHVGMMKPDRSIPRYGDHGAYDIRDRVLRKGARLFDRPDLNRLADEPNARNRVDGRLSFPFESNPYYLSGYYAMRDAWDVNAQYLSMDAGPFGTNHHHGDKLSITVSADGAPFIVDPGTSLYTSLDPGPRYDLRLGFLHNVLTVDGIDPNTGWDRHYGFDVLENRWVTNPVYDFLEGTYEFRNNLLDVLWRRSVVFVKGDYWIVLDALYGEGRHRVESNLQFMVGNEVQIADDRMLAKAPNGASLDIVDVLDEGLAPSVVIGDTTFPGTTFLIQYPGFVDWIQGGRGWVGTFGNESPLDPTQTHPAPTLLRAGSVDLPFKSATILTPSIDKRPREAEVTVLSDDANGFTLQIEIDSSTVDRFQWEIVDWRDHLEKISDDSGWWVRTVDSQINRIIVMNEDSVTVTSSQEVIDIAFDGPFEGRFDRTDEGWRVTPDAYNAISPGLLKFEVTSGGETASYAVQAQQPLVPNVGHALILEQ